MGVLVGKHVLVTGGLGFIGSHTCYALIKAGAEVTILDDLSNSFAEVLNRLSVLLGKDYSKITFKQVNITDRRALDAAFAAKKVDALVHFAAFKAVGESLQKPLEYYKNNLDSTIAIGEMMKKHSVHHMVFSSSCTVYGEPERVPIDEKCSLNSTTSPYARTKVMGEMILRDLCAAETGLDVCLLRYFNPVAAHPSGLIGEHPIGVPQNLMPFVQQVASGKRPLLKVFGNDYHTRDGTTVRDYIHIMDLAEAHVAALERMVDTSKERFGCRPINVGTGTGTTVLEMVAAMEKACGHELPREFAPRRDGDTVAVWAATDVSEKELGWKARYSVDDMARDQWNWAKRFPGGYEQILDLKSPAADTDDGSVSMNSEYMSAAELGPHVGLEEMDLEPLSPGFFTPRPTPIQTSLVPENPTSLYNPVDHETPSTPTGSRGKSFGPL